MILLTHRILLYCPRSIVHFALKSSWLIFWKLVGLRSGSYIIVILISFLIVILVQYCSMISSLVIEAMVCTFLSIFSYSSYRFLSTTSEKGIGCSWKSSSMVSSTCVKPPFWRRRIVTSITDLSSHRSYLVYNAFLFSLRLDKSILTNVFSITRNEEFFM